MRLSFFAANIMQDCISLNEAARRWHDLLELKRAASTLAAPILEMNNHWEDDEDHYDCADLVIPTLAQQAESVAEQCANEWRDLEDRRLFNGEVVTSNAATSNDNDATHDEPTPKKVRMALPSWYERHVRLPEGFDYATRQSGPPDVMNDNDRVVSLQDPTATQSYQHELWHLYAQVPTLAELQDATLAQHHLPRLQAVLDEIAIHSANFLRLDGHNLARLRMSHRHGRPHPTKLVQKASNDTMSSLQASIVFECWRRGLRRGSMPDPSRLIIEFSATQTLLDVHRTLMELHEDMLWDQQNSSTAGTAGDDLTSGVFFIDNTFYRHGNVDYNTPIQAWLSKGTTTQRRKRHNQLNIQHNDPLPVRSMADTTLGSLELRLGVRYVHVCHGDVETAIFGVDRHVRSEQPLDCPVTFPVLHDVWESNAIPNCDACQHRLATLVTNTTCEVTAGHRVLCRPCWQSLLQSSPNETARATLRQQCTPLSKWRQSVDISMTARGETAF